MTRQQIEEHREVIKWWLDNPDNGVWRKLNNDWVLAYSPQFYETSIYVQNDKYAEFRKALADSKMVELDNTYLYDTSKEKGWITIDKIFDHIPLTHYRIKPEEPEFKVGDWVYANSHLCKLEATKSGNLYAPIPNRHDCIQGVKLSKLQELNLWKPKEGEWCVFWNRDIQEYLVTPFQGKLGERYITRLDDSFRHIAPLEFIQTLKDK